MLQALLERLVAVTSRFVSRRHELIRDAYRALGLGELDPWIHLLDRAVVWQGVGQPDEDEGPTCGARREVIGRLASVYEQGRRFETFEFVDDGDTVVVGLRVSQPDWLGSADIYKRFTFSPGADIVIRMQDCTDRDAAVSMTHRIG